MKRQWQEAVVIGFRGMSSPRRQNAAPDEKYAAACGGAGIDAHLPREKCNATSKIGIQEGVNANSGAAGREIISRSRMINFKRRRKYVERLERQGGKEWATFGGMSRMCRGNHRRARNEGNAPNSRGGGAGGLFFA